MSIPDALIGNYFELATTVPMGEVAALLAKNNPMEAKLRLATEIVSLYHGPDPAAKAAEHFDRTVRKKEVPDEMPEVRVTPDLLKDGKIWVVKLIRYCGFAATNGEARRLVSQGGVTLDGEAVTDADADLAVKDGQILRAGKRNFAKIRL
jgi:tyrosyl-tRNA synthetase